MGPSRTETIILRLLADSPELFGLQMVELAEGHLKRGTIYVTLQRMEQKGLVSSRQEVRPAGESGIPRRLYKITGDGRRILEAWELFEAKLAGQLA